MADDIVNSDRIGVNVGSTDDLYNLRNTKRTWRDLEDTATEQMIMGCKLDACLDTYLKGLAAILPKQTRSYYWDPLPDPTLFEGEDAEKHNHILDELRTNLNTLLPRYLTKDEADVLSNEKLKHSLEARWTWWNFEGRRVFGTAAGDRDSFRGALLNTLMEQRYEGRSSSDQIAGWEACRQLRHYVDGQSASASFTCGGTISIGVPEKVDSSAICSGKCSAPVNIFWASGGGSNARKIVLPLTDDANESGNSTLQQLVKDCQPATFGKGQQDVFDPEYRKAGKMDSCHFATSFHPADFGILENIERILLPSISDETENTLGFRKLTAELYKLNVYSGPSGLFRKHVDTPRSENQIGSLVVCLPSQFKGGVFTVQHDKQKVEFDWSERSKLTIQWAAFYSDCEHEIHTVTEGERVTLTYNLYVTEPAGSISPNNGIVQPQSLPLYSFLKDLMAEESFMPRGGVLGVYCSHSYAHNSEIADLQLPRGLKGANLVLCSVFKSLGMEVDVLPVLEYGGNYGSENQKLDIKGVIEGAKTHYLDSWGPDRTKPWLRYWKNGEDTPKIEYSQILPPGIVHDMDINQYWKLLLMSRRESGLREVAELAKEKGVAVDGVYAAEGARVATERKPYTVTHRGQDEDMDDVSKYAWPTYYLPGIVWINEPKHEEMAFSQIAYGNEASVGTRYSCAAILAVIPPATDRKEMLRKL